MSVPRMRRVAPFDPTQAGGCVLWLDGSDPAGTGIAPANSASVTSWIDKSGSGNNATGGTAPSFNSTAINSKGALSFNGSTTSLNSQDLYSNRSFSIFMVIRRQASIPGFTGLLCGSSSSPNQNMTFAFRNDNVFTLGFYYNDVNYGSFASYTGNTSTEPAYIIEGTYTPGARVLYVNGNFASSDTNSTNLGSDPGPVIGGYSGQIFNGFIGELIVLNGIPADSSRIQIEGYLAQKWGLKNNLPGGHPGITNIIYPIRNTLSMTPRSYAFTFTPTGIAGFGLWLDGSDPSANGSIPSNGSTVSTWKDKSGNGYDGTGNGTYSSSGSNIVFNNSSYSLPTGTFISGSGSYTIVSIQSTNNAGGIEYFFSFGSLGAPQHLSFPHVSPNPYLSWYGNDYNFTYSMTSGRSFIAINSYNISSNLKYGYVNGSLDGSLTPSTGRNTGTSPNTLGVGPNGYNLNGTLSEILIFSSFLTTTQQQQVEGYLAWKWALQSYLPESHPYKSASPNVTNPLNVTRQALPSILFPTPKTSSGIVTLYPSYTNTNGLISYFLFDNTIADTRNTITLTQTGSYSFVTGNRGQAIYLANEANISASTFSSNYLTSTYNFPSTFTVSLWFRTASSSPASAIFNTNRNPTYVQGSITLYYAGGNLYVAYTSVQNNGAGYAIAANTWYNAVVTYNSGTTYLYVNGSQSGSAVNLTPVVINQGFMLGGSADNGPVYPFAGYIEDFRIYNRVLSGSEISAIYNGTG